MTSSEMSPADLAAVCGRNNNDDGFGFGGNGAWWIIILLLFGWGRNGFGNGFGGGGCGGGSSCATQADIAMGFNNSAVLSGINGIDSALCQGFNGINTAILQGFNGVERGFCDVSRQISDCCCQTQRAIDGVSYNMATQACETRRAISDGTRDIIDNANCNTRAILDFLTQDKIATLTAENQSLKFAASQSAQNGVIRAAIDASTAEIIRRTGNECPTPAYWVNPPTPVQVPCGFAGGNGCGCGNGF